MEDVQLIISQITLSPAPLASNLFTHFSLKLRKGDILGILGSNGVGKTTLLKCLSGCLAPQTGKIELNHHALFHSLSIKKHIGFLPDTVPLIPYFTVQENLNWMARCRGLDRHEAKKAITDTCERLGLQNWSEILAKHLSLGQRKLVGIAGTLVHQPILSILDEPLNDLDTQVRERVLEVLHDIGQHSIIIFTSHYHRDLATIANKILLLEKGQSSWVLDKSLPPPHKKTPNKTIKKNNKNKIVETSPL